MCSRCRWTTQCSTSKRVATKCRQFSASLHVGGAMPEVIGSCASAAELTTKSSHASTPWTTAPRTAGGCIRIRRLCVLGIASVLAVPTTSRALAGEVGSLAIRARRSSCRHSIQKSTSDTHSQILYALPHLHHAHSSLPLRSLRASDSRYSSDRRGQFGDSQPVSSPLT